MILNASSLLFLALTATSTTDPAPLAELPELNTSTTPVPAQDAEASEAPAWTGNVSLGAIMNTGNTESTAVAASMDAELRREKDRQTVNLFWNYGETTNSVPGGPEVTTITQRNVGGSYQYDYFIDEKTYYLANAGANTDSLALLDLRWYAGAGIGRQFRDEEDFTLKGEAGLVYIEERFQNMPPPAPSADSEGVAARLAWDVMKRLTETTVLEHTGQVFPSLKDIDNTYARLDTRLKMKMTENMNAQFQWILQWDNTPAPGLTSVDNQFIASLGWGF